MNQTIETALNFSIITYKSYSSSDNSYVSILFYCKLCLLIFGCFGNGFCIIIWLKREFIKMPRSICCIVLSLADTSYLILNFSGVAYNYIEEKTIFFISGPVCRFMLFGLGLAEHMDSWTIVLLTAERVISGKLSIREIRQILFSFWGTPSRRFYRSVNCRL